MRRRVAREPGWRQSAPLAVRPVDREKRRRERHERQFGPFADWIRKQKCAAKSAFCLGEVQAAHVKTRGAGGAAEANLVPLCVRHHAEQHQVGRATFEVRTGLDLSALAQRLWKKWSAQR